MDDGRCVRHQFELTEGICRSCGDGYCNECLVYSFGAKKPPYCVTCALAASGVRANGRAGTKVSRKELKRREKAHHELRKVREAQRQQTDSMTIDWIDEPSSVDDWDPVPTLPEDPRDASVIP